jgi:anaphase-promoting complex subunit 8
LYDKLNEFNHAAAAFTEYVTENELRADKSELCQAYKYLANYFIKRNQVDEAYNYAQKCLEYEEVGMINNKKFVVRSCFPSDASISLP